MGGVMVGGVTARDESMTKIVVACCLHARMPQRTGAVDESSSATGAARLGSANYAVAMALRTVLDCRTNWLETRP